MTGLLELFFFLMLSGFLLAAMQKLLWVKPPERFVSGAADEGAGSSVLPSRLNVLCLGIDSVEGTHRTDTILLVGIDPGNRRVEAVSIPRDTRVTIDTHARKINEITARHGIQALRTLIEDLMEIRIDRHVMIDFQGFVQVIDMLGGVEIDVERRMKYTDNWQKLYIDLMPGLQRLDGQKALQYVRFRADAAADLGRIKRQQKFIAALLQQLKSPGVVIKIPELVRQALNHIQTDLNVAEVVDLARAMLQGPMKINTQSLPGDAPYINGISYFVPYKDQAVAIGSKCFSSLVSLELDAGFTVGGASPTGAVTTSPIGSTTPPASDSTPVATGVAAP